MASEEGFFEVLQLFSYTNVLCLYIQWKSTINNNFVKIFNRQVNSLCVHDVEGSYYAHIRLPSSFTTKYGKQMFFPCFESRILYFEA